MSPCRPLSGTAVEPESGIRRIIGVLRPNPRASRRAPFPRLASEGRPSLHFRSGAALRPCARLRQTDRSRAGSRRSAPGRWRTDALLDRDLARRSGELRRSAWRATPERTRRALLAGQGAVDPAVPFGELCVVIVGRSAAPRGARARPMSRVEVLGAAAAGDQTERRLRTARRPRTRAPRTACRTPARTRCPRIARGPRSARS